MAPSNQAVTEDTKEYDLTLPQKPEAFSFWQELFGFRRELMYVKN
jgi:hypothetical protein